MKRDRFHLVTVLWGRWHVERLLRFCIPSLLAPQNIPAASERAQLRFTILTSAADHFFLSTAPMIRQLQRYASVEIRIMPGTPRGMERHLSSWRVMYEYCRQEREVLVVLHPDVVYSDGTISRITGAYEDPRIAVSLKSMTRVLGEHLEPILERTKSADGTLSVPGDELARLSMAHMHHSSSVTIQGSRIYRPTWEQIVLRRGGFAHGCGSFEIVAIDPQRGDVTSHFTNYNNIGPEIDVIGDVTQGYSVSLTPFCKSLELLSPAKRWDAALETAKGSGQELLRPIVDPKLDEHPFVFAGGGKGEPTAVELTAESKRWFFGPTKNYWRMTELRDLLSRHNSIDGTLLQLGIVNFTALRRLPLDRRLVLYVPTFSMSGAIIEAIAGRPWREMRRTLWRQAMRFFGMLDHSSTSTPGRFFNGTPFTFADDQLTWPDGRVEAVSVERTRYGDLLLSRKAAA